MKFSRYQTYYCVIFMIELLRQQACSNADDSLEFQRNLPAKLVWAIVGKTIDLPCDLSPVRSNDRVKMVLWFKDTIGIPIYNVDSRKNNLHEALHWAISDDLGSRTNFLIDSKSSKGKLRIENVSATDHGVFRCRVDFDDSPTRNYRVNLTFAEPPSQPEIYDAQNNRITSEIIGPYFEGHQLFLSCKVWGGKPKPKVSWWLNNSILDSIVENDDDNNDDEDESDEHANFVENKLYIAKIDRTLWKAELQCRALSLDFATPISRAVELLVFLKPRKTTILMDAEHYLSIKNTHFVKCESFGSYPPAQIQWLLGSLILNRTSTEIIDDELKTISTISLQLNETNDGNELVCRSENPRFSGSLLEHRIIINVTYPPKLFIKTIFKYEPNKFIREGDNFQLSCETDAKPPAYKYLWYHNDKLLEYNENTGTLPVKNLLYIQRATRDFNGNYSCSAANLEGESTSAKFNLKVLYSPYCKHASPKIIPVAVASGQIEKLDCEIDANPVSSVKFSWTYNNSRGMQLVQPYRAKITNFANTSIYYFDSRNDPFGTLACWASNSIGRQIIPCIFHIVPAEIPPSPENCLLRNHTINNKHYQYRIECDRFDRDTARTQSFLLEAVELFVPIAADSLEDNNNNLASVPSQTMPLQNDQAAAVQFENKTAFTLENSEPVFELGNLSANRYYKFVIYAKNRRGGLSTRPAQLYSLGSQAMLSSSETGLNHRQNQSIDNRNLVAACAAVIVTIIVLGTVLITTVRVCRARRKSNSGNVRNNCPDQFELMGTIGSERNATVVRRSKRCRSSGSGGGVSESRLSFRASLDSKTGFDDNFRRRSLDWHDPKRSLAATASEHGRDSLIFYHNEQLLAASKQFALGPDLILPQTMNVSTTTPSTPTPTC